MTEKLREKFREGIDWPTTLWLGTIMTIALLAWFFFTWTGLILCVSLAVITGLGVTMGYHRLFTHASFRTYRPIEWFLVFAGQLSGEGSVLRWVTNHRIHHIFSDREGDPHSPNEFSGFKGFCWGHLLWLIRKVPRDEELSLYRKHAKDLLERPLFKFLDATYLVWHVFLGLTLLLIGYHASGWYMAVSLVVWGMFVRMAYVLHSTWFVNSATHLWGYRNYITRDKSRNLWWVALLAFGEGWHNNHHKVPRAANHGVRWFEKALDPTYFFICVLKWLGLAWDVKKNTLKLDFEES